MTFIAWKQSYSRFPEQLDFSGSEIIGIYRRLKFVYVVQVMFSPNKLNILFGISRPSALNDI